jgi:ribosomal protein S18 acetylase RimI-like enzyme
VTSTTASLVSLRAVTPDDNEFLRRVYASTREAELGLVSWDEGQKAAFVDLQFEAQDRFYREQYAGASFQVVMVGDRPAGRLALVRWPDEIRIMDIALLPDFRGRGAGTRLIGDVMADAQELGSSVTIHVECNNPALDWYRGLGFTVAEDRGVYLFLRWEPQPSPAAASRP